MIVIFGVCLIIGLLYIGMIMSISPQESDGNLTGSGWGCALLFGFVPVALILWWMFS